MGLERLQIFSHRLLQLEGDSLHLGVLSQSIFSPGGGRHDSTVEAGQTRREGAAQDVAHSQKVSYSSRPMPDILYPPKGVWACREL